ncbi:MAG TPA: CDP-diacylglycerol--glycerol-3-phosphate 3-phosphatidyltransferase [Gammaproteobacteria bacterium]|nr:CDP-diacylglycerol--glycerol-3-phosphate 3-phosphatidyltransferase [Gammaproteobacteria bacterium]
MTIPNILTFIRILIIPIFVVFFYLPVPWGHTVAAILFAIAAITDWLDGYLARYLKQGSRFGTFLDPVADKLAVAVALVLIAGEMGSAYVAIPAAIIVGREIVISGLREWMAEIGKRTSVKVSSIGKFKTVVQMLSLIILVLYKPSGLLLVKVIGLVLLYIAVLLTLWSMIMYLKAAWTDLTLSTNKE